MKRRFAVIAACIFLVFSATFAVGWMQRELAGPGLTATAKGFVATLSEDEKKIAVLEYDSPKRVDWHFIPKDERKGLQVKNMSKEQKAAASKLLRHALSEAGYDKVTKIMELEKVLHELEGGKGRNIRDSQRYYYTLFGAPDEDNRWGLSIEGHHLSLNFVIVDNTVVSSTPQFLASNPATVKTKNETFDIGVRVLRDEEQLAFDLVNSLSDEQKKGAIIAEDAPSEIRAAGEAQPPQEEPAGIAAKEFNGKQKKLTQQLVESYLKTMPESVSRARVKELVAADPDKIHFAWAGATKPGVGHYYRVQGPTFLIEFVNTQPDPAGNPANHIHCVWRDMKGDFDLPIKK